MPLQVRRVLTDTPLARLHEHRLAGRGGKRAKPIPFSAFDRTKYPAPALALATDAQTKLALGEYGAVDLFAWMATASMKRPTYHESSTLSSHPAPMSSSRLPGGWKPSTRV